MTTPTTPTKIERHFYNKELSAETGYALNNGMTLKVSTHKGARGLRTYAQAVKIENGIESFMMFQDFNKTLQTVEGRATEKNILIAHNKAIQNIEQVIEEANKSYNC
jgi:hypothetical protein